MSSPDEQKRETSPQIEQAGASDENIQQVHSILLREKPEPTETKMPMPLFMLGFVSAMILMVAIYFVHNRGGFDPLVYDERFDPATAPTSVAEVKVDPIAQGKKLYNQVCAACHQATGMGVPGAFPPLAKSDWVTGNEERLVRILLHGLSGPITINGSTYNSAMPAIGPGSGYNFDDAKISYVLTYIRQEWGNNAPAIAPERVKEIRTGGAAGRTTPWTAAELEAYK